MRVKNRLLKGRDSSREVATGYSLGRKPQESDVDAITKPRSGDRMSNAWVAVAAPSGLRYVFVIFPGAYAPGYILPCLRHYGSGRWQIANVLMVVLLFTSCANSLEAREPDIPGLDKAGNNNGYIEPNEIPAEFRSIITRYASLAGLDMDKPMRVLHLVYGRNEYTRQLYNDFGPGSVWDEPANDKGFGRIADSSGVRPFGATGEMVGSYTIGVRNRTIGTFRSYDSNRDTVLSREEVSNAYKSAIHSWFRADHDHSGTLTFNEMADYFAADELRQKISRDKGRGTWKIGDVKVTEKHRQHADWLMSKMDKNKNNIIDRDEVPDEWKTGNGLSWADANGDGQVTKFEMQVGAVRFLSENEQAAERRTDPNLQTCDALASDMIRRYDRNNDRALDRYERAPIGGDLMSADLNNNGLVHQNELNQWLLSRLKAQPSAELPEGLPVWFVESDVDLDGQVELSEFRQANPQAVESEFTRFDHNRDGIVTADESVARTAGGKRRYSSNSPRVFEASKETYSELFIDEAVTIADIDVQVTITKRGDDDIALLLIGPDDTTATLYYTAGAKPWGGGRLFEDTIIDDEAPEITQRLRLPPAHRSFRPQGMNNQRMQSLNAFYGKSSQGVWRLVVRNNSRVAGLLEGWSLLVKPTESVEPD